MSSSNSSRSALDAEAKQAAAVELPLGKQERRAARIATKAAAAAAAAATAEAEARARQTHKQTARATTRATRDQHSAGQAHDSNRSSSSSSDYDGNLSDGDDNDHEEEQQQGNGGADANSADDNDPEDDSADDEGVTDVTTLAGMQAALMLVLQQQKQAEAAAKAQRAQDRARIAQLETQLQQQAASTVRMGIMPSSSVIAPAARSTLKTEPAVAARQRQLQQLQETSGASPSLKQRQRAMETAEAARAPAAPGVQAALRAAPPRADLPKVKQELEAAALSKDPTLLKAWQFQIERLLRVMEAASEQEFTFGDRLSTARLHWDAGIDAWWTSLCESRASTAEAQVCSWAGLIAALQATYAPVSDGLAAGREMQQIRQGTSESMEAYVRRALDLQSRLSEGQWPSAVVAMLVLNGVDETRFPWTCSAMHMEAAEFAARQLDGRGPDMAIMAHRLRTKAASEPKVQRGAGAGGSNAGELASLKAELAKIQRQLAQGSATTHTAAALNTFSGSSTSGDSEGRERSTQRGGRGGSKFAGKRLSSTERQRRYDNDLCFRCNKAGHISRECPERTAQKQQQQHERGAEGAPSSGN